MCRSKKMTNMERLLCNCGTERHCFVHDPISEECTTTYGQSWMHIPEGFYVKAEIEKFLKGFENRRKALKESMKKM